MKGLAITSDDNDIEIDDNDPELGIDITQSTAEQEEIEKVVSISQQNQKKCKSFVVDERNNVFIEAELFEDEDNYPVVHPDAVNLDTFDPFSIEDEQSNNNTSPPPVSVNPAPQPTRLQDQKDEDSLNDEGQGSGNQRGRGRGRPRRGTTYSGQGRTPRISKNTDVSSSASTQGRGRGRGVSSKKKGQNKAATQEKVHGRGRGRRRGRGRGAAISQQSIRAQSSNSTTNKRRRSLSDTDQSGSGSDYDQEAETFLQSIVPEDAPMVERVVRTYCTARCKAGCKNCLCVAQEQHCDPEKCNCTNCINLPGSDTLKNPIKDWKQTPFEKKNAPFDATKSGPMNIPIDATITDVVNLLWTKEIDEHVIQDTNGYMMYCQEFKQELKLIQEEAQRKKKDARATGTVQPNSSGTSASNNKKKKKLAPLLFVPSTPL
ncbi:hypothetical protein AKO1_013373, partial [Acrasis kona]